MAHFQLFFQKIEQLLIVTWPFLSDFIGPGRMEHCYLSGGGLGNFLGQHLGCVWSCMIMFYGGGVACGSGLLSFNIKYRIWTVRNTCTTFFPMAPLACLIFSHLIFIFTFLPHHPSAKSIMVRPVPKNILIRFLRVAWGAGRRATNAESNILDCLWRRVFKVVPRSQSFKLHNPGDK